MQTRDFLALLPSKPSDDPRSEISALLHAFTSDISRHVEGMSNISSTNATSFSGQGLIQSINPALEKFRRAIRYTAPNFRPFEKEDSLCKHLHEASFLRSEEGDECEDEASDLEDDNDDDASVPNHSPRQRKRPRKISQKIYIDEVLEAAQL